MKFEIKNCVRVKYLDIYRKNSKLPTRLHHYNTVFRYLSTYQFVN